MKSITIEKITIPFNKELLDSWKRRDPEVVPNFMLEKNGPGVSNGYGFGEWIAERYLRNKGYYIFSNDFNFISKTSKFFRFNKMIETMFSREQLDNFKAIINLNQENKLPVENIDLFVYDSKDSYFAEVKKGRDKLRDPQIRFIYLAKNCLGIDSKLIYLCDKSQHEFIEKERYNVDIILNSNML